MDPEALATMAIGWAVTVTGFVVTLVLSGKLRLGRECEALGTALTTATGTIDALRAEIKALAAEALAATAKQVTAAQEEARVYAEERTQLLALLGKNGEPR